MIGSFEIWLEVEVSILNCRKILGELWWSLWGYVQKKISWSVLFEEAVVVPHNNSLVCDNQAPPKQIQ
jgi:hypothetical protein